MAYARHVGAGLDYVPCRYGRSKLVFRGPQPPIQGGYVAFLGSTETYGKFVARPFPDLAGRALGTAPLNLGCVNAGIDTFHADDTVLELVRGARACVIQVMGAHKLSNGFYTVHPRRNDRFLGATDRLRALYPEADFAEIHFTRHLLGMLRRIDPERFETVVSGLRETWIGRMRTLVGRAGVPVVLVWASQRRPEEGGNTPGGPDPLFVTRGMLDEIAPVVARIVEVAVPRDPASRPDAGMIYSEVELPAALALPGPAAHTRIAEAIVPALDALIR